MKKNSQHLMDTTRQPRVQITYDVEVSDAVESCELPYVFGIMADLSGMSPLPRAPLQKRKFVTLTPDNFDNILSSIHPSLSLEIKNCLQDQCSAIPPRNGLKHRSD